MRKAKHPGAPEHCAGQDSLTAGINALGIDQADACGGVDSDTKPFQVTLRLGRVPPDKSAGRATPPHITGSCAAPGSMWRKSCVSAIRDISARVPAISTPTVPAPTSTNVNNLLDGFRPGVTASGESLRALKASSTLPRISSASSSDDSPGAICCHSSCPK
jgi:hypothetical protein